jgi:hypothetical protein
MPGQGKYSFYADTVAPSPFGAEGARGASNQTLLKTLFAPRPEMAQAAVKATANAELVPDVLPKNPDPLVYSADDIKLGFGASPSIPNGPYGTTDIGAPANPWVPNLTSPDPTGAGGTSPITALPLDPIDVNKHAIPGVDGLVDPAVSSAEQSNATKIGTTLVLGKHPGSQA